MNPDSIPIVSSSFVSSRSDRFVSVSVFFLYYESIVDDRQRRRRRRVTMIRSMKRIEYPCVQRRRSTCVCGLYTFLLISSLLGGGAEGEEENVVFDISRTFNGAYVEEGTLVCGTTYGYGIVPVDESITLSGSEGFTVSLWYRTESTEEGAEGIVKYLLSAGGVPGSGNGEAYLAIALPGDRLASRGHLRVYVSPNQNMDEFDFVDVRAPPNDDRWHHVVVVQRPGVARPDVYVDLSSLGPPHINWWVCGACGDDESQGHSDGLNCWADYGGCYGCRSERVVTPGCAPSEGSRLVLRGDVALCTRSDLEPRRTFSGRIACVQIWNVRALVAEEIVELSRRGCPPVRRTPTTSSSPSLPSTSSSPTAVPTTTPVPDDTARIIGTDRTTETIVRGGDEESPGPIHEVAFDALRDGWAACLSKLSLVAALAFVIGIASHLLWNPRCTTHVNATQTSRTIEERGLLVGEKVDEDDEKSLPPHAIRINRIPINPQKKTSKQREGLFWL